MRCIGFEGEDVSFLKAQEVCHECAFASTILLPPSTSWTDDTYGGLFNRFNSFESPVPDQSQTNEIGSKRDGLGRLMFSRFSIWKRRLRKGQIAQIR